MNRSVREAANQPGIIAADAGLNIAEPSSDASIRLLPEFVRLADEFHRRGALCRPDMRPEYRNVVNPGGYGRFRKQIELAAGRG